MYKLIGQDCHMLVALPCFLFEFAPWMNLKGENCVQSISFIPLEIYFEIFGRYIC